MNHVSVRKVSGFSVIPQYLRSRGFTYIGVLIFIAVLGVLLAVAGNIASTQRKRERERELLFVGDQFRKAIGQYYERSPGLKQFPKSIDDLLLDRRYPSIQRYLKRPFRDPITGKSEWGLVSGPGDTVMGVYSLSEDKPLKQVDFKDEYAPFEGANRYSDWQFVYVPVSMIPVKK
jgi:type II secretory pathway pseudopilin PulG